MYTLCKYPNPVLRQVALPVGKINDDIRNIASEMQRVMTEHHGIGLAANQIGVLLRIIVVAIPNIESPPVIINPVLTTSGRKLWSTEGCLSHPETHLQVRRTEIASITGLNLDGIPIQMTATGLLAACWQHEVDHLNGISIIDKLMRKAIAG